ncbi:MAG: hypothetical protein GXO70_09450 [Acidobacteria bacterium]|nr:hypothetical protein [Acidobacteriota bacterium]
MTYTIIIVATIIFNIFCGIFRVRQTKLTWKLFYIHIPIPFIAWVRISSGISWKFIPVLVFVALGSQVIGGKLPLGIRSKEEE